MWFLDMKYNNNCSLGMHFYNREEMFDWISSSLRYYTFVDEFTDLHIWFDNKEGGK